MPPDFSRLDGFLSPAFCNFISKNQIERKDKLNVYLGEPARHGTLGSHRRENEFQLPIDVSREILRPMLNFLRTFNRFVQHRQVERSRRLNERTIGIFGFDEENFTSSVSVSEAES